jgi:endonuclease I
MREGDPGPGRLAAELDTLEASLPFNCEHVVPQSWFDRDEPMRGDLHHLFTCESRCNSFRGNFPYIDFPDFGEAVRTDCGRREAQGFEPGTGKGPIARATLYFLLRYPGLVGDERGELPRERLELLLTWHEQDPVSDYERHRNFAIAEIQGNRNPLIDRPEWAREIDFAGAWAVATHR